MVFLPMLHLLPVRSARDGRKASPGSLPAMGTPQLPDRIPGVPKVGTEGLWGAWGLTPSHQPGKELMAWEREEHPRQHAATGLPHGLPPRREVGPWQVYPPRQGFSLGFDLPSSAAKKKKKSYSMFLQFSASTLPFLGLRFPEGLHC